MNLPFFILLLFVLQILYWIVGKKCTKNPETKMDYFLAEKNVRFFPLMMTFLATQVGGGLVLGSADEAYRFGWPVLLYPLGASLGLILLGAGIGKRLAGFQVSTVAQIFEVAYRSKALKIMASLLSIISLFMILVAQIIASRKFLASLGFTNEPLFLLFWAIVILYTAQGGLKALISTDLVQAAFFSFVFLFSFIFVLSSDAPLPFSWPTVESWTTVSPKLCGWLFMPLLFIVIEQDMAQRCFSGASVKIVSRASWVAGLITMILCVVPIFFGVLAKDMNLLIPPGSSVLMTTLSSITNPYLTAFLGCAVLAAIISTATSLINAISSNIANDFVFDFLQKGKELVFIKVMTFALSIASLLFAFSFNVIIDVLIQSYELSVSCLFVPILYALFKKEGNFLSALLSILMGGIAFCIFQLYSPPIPKEICSILVSLIGFGAGEVFLLYRKKTNTLVETSLN